MTTTPQPPSYMPGAVAPTSPAGGPPPRKRVPLIVGAVVALLVAIAGTVALTLSLSGGGQPTAGPVQAAASLPTVETVVDEPTSAPAVAAPKPADFKLAVKVTRKKCFGSAGCNVDYEIDMTYAGDMLALADGRSYQVTYEVKGAEDQIIGTLDIEGDSYSSTEESTETAKSSSKLTAVATSVTER